ncbi:MAG: hypothetical protein IPG03_06970 [Candidatus Microthrix sp.]|nr:hypothetical protein [Candidatus Microthrix sp.]
MAPALDRLAMSTDLPLVAKPNLGGVGSRRRCDPCWCCFRREFIGRSWPLEAWLDLGAADRGCCGTGTFQLSRLAAQLANLGPAGGHETR